MSYHVLVPYDGSESAERGLDRAVERYPEARVTVLSVVDPLSEQGHELADAPLEPGEPLEHGDDGLRADGGAAPELDGLSDEHAGNLRTVVEAGKPASTIVDYADEHAIDEVVVGSRGRSGLSRLLFGSVAEAVGRHATTAVTVVEGSD